jgi:hypothetical protein
VGSTNHSRYCRQRFDTTCQPGGLGNAPVNTVWGVAPAKCLTQPAKLGFVPIRRTRFFWTKLPGFVTAADGKHREIESRRSSTRDKSGGVLSLTSAGRGHEWTKLDRRARLPREARTGSASRSARPDAQTAMGAGGGTAELDKSKLPKSE